jgi:hypothetical protein
MNGMVAFAAQRATSFIIIIPLVGTVDALFAPLNPRLILNY